MLEFRISKLAKRDLEKIWNFTANEWSPTQANKYYNSLIRGIKSICKNPGIGRSIQEVKKEHRILPIKSHLIVYKFDRNIVFVDRILHRRMDIDSRLDSE